MNTFTGTTLPRFIALLAACAAVASCGQQQPQASASSVRDAASENRVAQEPLEPSPQLGVTPGLEVYTSTGVVETVDAQSGKMRIRHDGVPSLQLPAGTTEFTTENKEMTSFVKKGQPIEFRFALLSEGGYMLTELSPTPPES